MEPCEYCKSRESVMWNWVDGNICLDCYNRRQATARQAAIQKENDLRDFFHE